MIDIDYKETIWAVRADIRKICEETIEEWSFRMKFALRLMDREREPLYMADGRLWDEIGRIIGDYSTDHPEIPEDWIDNIEPEEILFYSGKED